MQRNSLAPNCAKTVPIFPYIASNSRASHRRPTDLPRGIDAVTPPRLCAALTYLHATLNG